MVAEFTRRAKTLYMHVHFWPGTDDICIGGLRTKVKSARFLRGGKRIAFEQDAYRVKLTGLPRKAPDSPVTVIALECASAPKQDRLAVRTKKRRGKVDVS